MVVYCYIMLTLKDINYANELCAVKTIRNWDAYNVFLGSYS